MRYANRRDDNEKAGCDVLQCQDFDLAVGRAGRNFLLEVKVDHRPSRLRKIQKQLRGSWRGQYDIVTTVDEALRAVGLGSARAPS